MSEKIEEIDKTNVNNGNLQNYLKMRNILYDMQSEILDATMSDDCREYMFIEVLINIFNGLHGIKEKRMNLEDKCPRCNGLLELFVVTPDGLVIFRCIHCNWETPVFASKLGLNQ